MNNKPYTSMGKPVLQSSPLAEMLNSDGDIPYGYLVDPETHEVTSLKIKLPEIKQLASLNRRMATLDDLTQVRCHLVSVHRVIDEIDRGLTNPYIGLILLEAYLSYMINPKR